MVRAILANRKLEQYVEQIAKEEKFCYGIVVGQTSSFNKDYVVHLAKTSEPSEFIELEKSSNSRINASENAVGTSEVNENKLEETLENFDGQNLVNHSVSVTKMLPGSFHVLGAFIITEKSISKNTNAVNKFKSIFRELNSALLSNKFLCACPSNQENCGKILFNYIWSTRSFECKLFDNSGSNSLPVDWKFLDKPTVWHMFESSYELEDIFPAEEGKNFNSENDFLPYLECIKNYLENSEIFIQNENVDEDQLLENYLKEKSSKNKKESFESLKATILQLLSIKANDPPTITEYNGTVRYSGTISSRVWVHPKSSFKDIQQFIRNDILRSIAARIQIFCDGFTTPNKLYDTIIVNIPPKRVFFKIPDSGGIQFSEYLFNGENAQTVIDQARDILDLEIDEKNILMDVETLPNYEDTITTCTQISSNVNTDEQSNVNDEDGKKLMIFIGIAVAVIVLVLSYILHLLLR